MFHAENSGRRKRSFLDLVFDRERCSSKYKCQSDGNDKEDSDGVSAKKTTLKETQRRDRSLQMFCHGQFSKIRLAGARSGSASEVMVISVMTSVMSAAEQTVKA